MQKKSELPEGWITTALTSISHKITDGSHNPPQKQSSGKFMISARNIGNDGINFDNARYITENEFQIERQRADIEPGDVLLSIVGTIGRVVVVPENLPEFAIQRSIALIKTKVNSEFLVFYFQSDKCQYYLQENSKGTAQKGIYLNQLKKVPINLPPLPEQHRIVSAIEALFARLDATNEKLDKVPEILKKFRESVLAAACEGRLTENWRVKNFNVESADEILDKILKERAISKLRKLTKFDEANIELNDLPENWIRKPLKEISINSDYGTSVKCDYEFKGFPVLRIPNISEGKVDLSDLKFASEDDNFPNLKFLRKNDLLIVRTNGSKELIGRAALYTGSSYEKILFASYLIRYQLPDSDTLCKWILSIWHSGLIRDWIINQAATSAGQYNISLSKLNDLPIPLPPLIEQEEIVKRVDALLTFADSIEEKVAAAREKTEKLRQSILAKAFSGELVETEAEIARREGRDYETAEFLIERIKEEKKISKKK